MCCHVAHPDTSTFIHTPSRLFNASVNPFCYKHLCSQNRTMRFTEHQLMIGKTVCTQQGDIWSSAAVVMGEFLQLMLLAIQLKGSDMYGTSVTNCSRPSGVTAFSKSPFCPHTVFMCFVWIWEQTAIISLYSINWLVCITKMESVYCAVRTGSLNTVEVKLLPLQCNIPYQWSVFTVRYEPNHRIQLRLNQGQSEVTYLTT